MRRSHRQETNMTKYYILAQPTRLSDLTLDEYEETDNLAWRDKARKLQARRWRKIKHQLA